MVCSYIGVTMTRLIRRIPALRSAVPLPVHDSLKVLPRKKSLSSREAKMHYRPTCDFANINL
eukprot:348311-Amphidinium_carterae.1